MAETTDYSSVYTIKDFYQKHILPLYFNPDKMALSTVGDLGLMTDISATSTEDMLNLMGRYINESMPGKAELPDFIYADAANFGISDIMAKPAKMSMLLLVKEKDVIEYGKVVDGHKEFIIDSDMTILVDDLQYSIPYNIKIRSNLFNGEYIHMSFYDKSYMNSISEETVPFIKTMRTHIYGDTWLGLRVNVYQYIRQEYNELINTNSILNIPYVDVNFANQLCNFEVFYTPPGSTKETQLIKRMDLAPAITDPFVFYKITSDTTLRLSFANDDRYFLPEYGSNLRIYMYESNGKSGNFGYSKEGIAVYIRGKTENEDIAYNRNIFPMGLSQGNSVGGKSQLQLEQIKLLTAEAQTTVKSYTTEPDLNTYFANFVSVYNHDIKVVKQRDDYAGREYGCFTRIGDGVDIFPTNTLDLRLAVTDVDQHFESLRQYIVKPGTIFQYENDSTSSVVKRKPDGADTQEIEYALAPLMVIRTKPNQVNFYMNTVNHKVQVDYTYFDINTPFNFVVKSFTISRNAIHGEDEYKLDLQLYRVDGVFNDVQMRDFELQSSQGEIEPERLKVIVIFDTMVGNYIPLELYQQEDADDVGSDYTYKFSGVIGTTDMIDDKRILLTNLLKRENDETDERLIDIIDPDLKIGVFYDYEDIPGGDHEYSDISLVKNCSLCNLYEPKDNEFYFAYPLNLMRSHVMFEDRPETEAGFGFYIKQVPLFGAKFLMSEDCDIDTILDDISTEHTFLSRIVNLLHGLFTINMKFYCTYGRGRSFYIGYGTSDEIINRVNCDISIAVKFFDGIIVEDYIEQVRIFIKDYFEKINKLASGANQAFISSLSQKLHNTFSDQIEYAIFYSINGYESKYQVIKMLTPMDESPVPDFVPEYLTLKTSDIKLTTL